MPDFAQLVSFGQTVIIIFLILIFMLRLSPRWERVRMKELDVRAIEAASREKEANSRIEQAASLTALAGVIKDVAVEQNKMSEQNEELKIFLKVSVREYERIDKRLQGVEEKVSALKAESGNAK